MTDIASPTPSPANGKSAVGPLLFVLVLIVVGYFGFSYLIEQDRIEHRRQHAAMIASIDAASARDREKAMLLGKALRGMSKYDVLKSMGQPDGVERVSQIQDEQRKEAMVGIHVFEIMHYDEKGTSVFLNTEGTVVWVTEPE